MQTKDNTHSCDLMVIGAGMAGMAAALFAARRGLSVAQTGLTGETLYASGLFDLYGVAHGSERELIDNAARIGAYILERMRGWPFRFPHVGDVRGLGLMIGIEIVRDQETRQKAPELRDRLVQRAFERGLLLLGAGENVIRLSPPLVITCDQADFAVDTLESCLETLTI